MYKYYYTYNYVYMYMYHYMCICTYTHIMRICCTCIREYGSTLYEGMAREKNGRPYISIASDELKSLVLYTDKF